MDNFWIPKLIENGYKKVSAVTGYEENPKLIENGYKKVFAVNGYEESIIFGCSVSWFFKRPFVVAATSTNAILYFFLLSCDPTHKKFFIHPEATVSSGRNSELRGLIRIEKSEEIQRLIEAIPNDLALCLDIEWAKPLIEVYFKKYASFQQ